MGIKRKAGNKKQSDIFKSRYGMDWKEWAKFKKEHPKEAHEKYMKVGNPH